MVLIVFFFWFCLQVDPYDYDRIRFILEQIVILSDTDIIAAEKVGFLRNGDWINTVVENRKTS